ncbi:o-succinylbenzoate synthase [Nocardioides sp. R-C-SC26]|uniref:o-succinylbenzoate synthase n=1 Tax=Nocardioides sp. R-C-SC26 TaxID=2870414 RepID=UPI001E546377|nr:o-succinylbenzoate synthase [Nocardioides sp. R-C-SC26]
MSASTLERLDLAEDPLALTPSRIDLVEVGLPLVRPFRTSFGTSTTRAALLLRVETADGVVGWSECAADPEPLYSEEYLAGAEHVLLEHLLPRLAASGRRWSAGGVADLLAPIAGHRMAKAALETALLDAGLRAIGRSFVDHFAQTLPAGATPQARVPAGVSVGIADSLDALLAEVAEYVDRGYVRIKLKIEPGWDVDPVREVRRSFGDIALQVDANAAYRIDVAEHVAALVALDEFDLLLVEQPLAAEDLAGHVALARHLATPICLDESVRSVRDARGAVELGACHIVNVKPARVGGYLEALHLHAWALGSGVPLWCGGMLETGIGRAANLALAALPGFTLPGDVSASDRYYARDLTTPFELNGGAIAVPTGAGIGVAVDDDALAAVTRRRHTWTPS